MAKKKRVKKMTNRERILAAIDFIGKDHDAEILLLGNPRSA